MALLCPTNVLLGVYGDKRCSITADSREREGERDGERERDMEGVRVRDRGMGGGVYNRRCVWLKMEMEERCVTLCMCVCIPFGL